MTSKKNFYIVLVGMDGSVPPNQILRNCMNAVKKDVAEELGVKFDEVYVNIQSEKASDEQKNILGDKSIHVQQYDIGVDASPEPQVIESIVTDKLQDLGFNVTGTELKEIDNKQFYYQ